MLRVLPFLYVWQEKFFLFINKIIIITIIIITIIIITIIIIIIIIIIVTAVMHGSSGPPSFTVQKK